MGKKNSAVWSYRWKDEVIVIGLLTAFAFLINSGIEIKGLFLDDLYLWSCYGEQSFREFVFPIGSTRFRFVYYLAAYIQMALIGNHINWFVPFNILLNTAIAYTVFRFGRKLSQNSLIGFICGILYLLSRMSYYQISQVYGLMESLALWAAMGILYCLYRYLNEAEGKAYYWAAGGLYFGVCFIHERYMVLLPLLLLALIWKKEKRVRNWLVTAVLFGLVLMIRYFTIGTLSPAGTGGTTVADTLNLTEAIKFALSQVCYLFGVNLGEQHLSGCTWMDSPRWVKVLVAAADLVLLFVVLAFIVKIVSDKKERKRYLMNSFLFILFIGACIACSSVTIRVEVRWVYVSMTASWLFLAYMLGVIVRPVSKPGQEEKTAICLSNYNSLIGCIVLMTAYFCLMFPVETYYRGTYPNLYFWHKQESYNSLAEETYEKYGDAIFGKKIYIIGNSYGVSDFNASTFFKTFDRNRKAEGTEVIFVDSIRDFGLVTDNMIVLREEPAFYAYQDITDMVRSLKCEAVYGYYRDGWMDEEAEIRIMAGSTGTIKLQLLYPGTLTGDETAYIYRDGRLVDDAFIIENITYVEIEAEPYETVDLTFKNNFYLEGAQEQRGEKRFSMIVNITAD